MSCHHTKDHIYKCLPMFMSSLVLGAWVIVYIYLFVCKLYILLYAFLNQNKSIYKSISVFKFVLYICRNEPKTDFSVPVDLKRQISNFEKTYTAPTQQSYKKDEVTENLFS